MTQFDPYRKWLGIPPQEQPADHYRLLGIGLFEADPDVIANAADRQMVHVRSFQSGPYSDISQRILNELAGARICLLDPAKKAAYDEQLCRAVAAKRGAASATGSFARPQRNFVAPAPVPRMSVPVQSRPAQSMPAPPVAPPLVPPPVDVAQTADYAAVDALTGSDQSRPARRKTRKKQALPVGAMLGGLAVVAIILGLLLWSLFSDGGSRSSRGGPATNSQTQRPSTERPGTSETKPAPRKDRVPKQTPWAGDGTRSGPVRNPLSSQTGEIMRWKAPAGEVSEVAYSPFGDIAAFGGPATAAHIWDLQTKSPRELKGVDGTILSLAFSSNGDRILVGTGTAQPPAGGKLAVCTFPEGEVAARVDLGKSLVAHDARFSPSGKLIAMACEDGTVRLVQASDGKDVKTLAGHKGPARSVAFSLDDSRLLSGGDDGIVRLWDISSGKPLAELEGHAGPVASVAMSLDGKRAVSGGADKIVRIWDLPAKKCLFRCQGHTGEVAGVAYAPDGACVISGAADGTLRLWLAADGSQAHQFTAHEGGVLSVRFSGDGRHAVSGGRDGTVRIWGVPDWKMAALELTKDQPVAKPTDTRAGEPTAEQQAAIEKKLKEDVFKADFDALTRPGAKPEAKKPLLDKLLAEGQKPQSDAATSFVILRVARDMAVEWGDVDAMLAAVNEIDKHCAIDAFAMKLAMLEKMAEGTMPLPKRKALTLKLIAVVDEAAAAEHYDTASALVKLVNEQAIRAREPAIAKQALACEKNLQQLKQKSEAINAARETLKKTPGDAEANLLVGKHDCFKKDDWTAGLKHLAASSDADLKALAAKELAAPSRVEDQLAVGHAWWDAGEKQPKDLREPFQLRAAYWYRKVKPKLIGLDQTKVERRLAELGKEPPGTGGGATTAPPIPDAPP